PRPAARGPPGAGHRIRSAAHGHLIVSAVRCRPPDGSAAVSFAPAMLSVRTACVVAAVAFVCGSITRVPTGPGSAPAGPPLPASLAGNELLQVLGEGVIGSAESAPPLRDPRRIARWETGQWQYRITSGARRGQTEVESLAPISPTARGHTC